RRRDAGLRPPQRRVAVCLTLTGAFLGTLSAAVLAGAGAAYSKLHAPAQAVTSVVAAPRRVGEVATGTSARPATSRVALPGGRVLNRLPGDGDLLTLTLDESVN